MHTSENQVSVADLRPRADLRDANLRASNLSDAYLSDANLWGADLQGASLRGADLRGADLYGANLRAANLRGADLYGANLQGANLYEANLRSANLHGANLHGAILRSANLNDAHWDGLRIDGLPSGQLTLVPTPDGWTLRVGCWAGTPESLHELVAGDGWPEARGEERERRRPILAAVTDMCDAHIAANPNVIAELAEWHTATQNGLIESPAEHQHKD